uniref:Uncharacterized protein n=1 Tax=Chromera velia CCMP2878 TaxID=1169474 RepID=A0A0G4H2M8_9ALVE|eukprot:Cvel_24452.t1-p1 / transcript=Cvel_24452.t1 / gene=Cvel_24452 / organism=Chromera_velia_CCMP2878 / gene_product=hypothetical protein / transcript_product=hypothetical protein / location=Cvel_scaffold2644:4961-8164(+) / protein_length=828 / sequence_SO=supercontig / SO=protein_coding / is_pseudo=false
MPAISIQCSDGEVVEVLSWVAERFEFFKDLASFQRSSGQSGLSESDTTKVNLEEFSKELVSLAMLDVKPVTKETFVGLMGVLNFLRPEEQCKRFLFNTIRTQMKGLQGTAAWTHDGTFCSEVFDACLLYPLVRDFVEYHDINSKDPRGDGSVLNPTRHVQSEEHSDTDPPPLFMDTFPPCLLKRPDVVNLCTKPRTPEEAEKGDPFLSVFVSSCLDSLLAGLSDGRYASKETFDNLGSFLKSVFAFDSHADMILALIEATEAGDGSLPRTDRFVDEVHESIKVPVPVVSTHAGPYNTECVMGEHGSCKVVTPCLQPLPTSEFFYTGREIGYRPDGPPVSGQAHWPISAVSKSFRGRTGGVSISGCVLSHLNPSPLISNSLITPARGDPSGWFSDSADCPEADSIEPSSGGEAALSHCRCSRCRDRLIFNPDVPAPCSVNQREDRDVYMRHGGGATAKSRADEHWEGVRARERSRSRDAERETDREAGRRESGPTDERSVVAAAAAAALATLAPPVKSEPGVKGDTEGSLFLPFVLPHMCVQTDEAKIKQENLPPQPRMRPAAHPNSWKNSAQCCVPAPPPTDPNPHRYGPSTRTHAGPCRPSPDSVLPVSSVLWVNATLESSSTTNHCGAFCLGRRLPCNSRPFAVDARLRVFVREPPPDSLSATAEMCPEREVTRGGAVQSHVIQSIQAPRERRAAASGSFGASLVMPVRQSIDGKREGRGVHLGGIRAEVEFRRFPLRELAFAWLFAAAERGEMEVLADVGSLMATADRHVLFVRLVDILSAAVRRAANRVNGLRGLDLAAALSASWERPFFYTLIQDLWRLLLMN